MKDPRGTSLPNSGNKRMLFLRYFVDLILEVEGQVNPGPSWLRSLEDEENEENKEFCLIVVNLKHHLYCFQEIL